MNLKRPKTRPNNYYYEDKLKSRGFDLVVGVDEAGRGPLAGPVVASAVLLKSRFFKNRIDDSKKLSPLQRERAFGEIVKNSVFGIGIISHKQIDSFNILVATQMAMEQAITKLARKLRPLKNKHLYVIVDGKVSLKICFDYTTIIKGDCLSKSIAAASIIAKVTRDRIMTEYDCVYPEYGFARHKGYPTKYHRRAITEFGSCLIHRKSFCGV
ncbi:MAG: ribonuclease HII [Candidatus Omnitrophota bacterium]|nr:ribonuclease HII [Candidatus Omnitrophota bacterium]MBU1928888.1 ribonuclease HII [Candidatus Omnitrophota bacterium]MBU2034498.1 ribonuclease HII [Candidatus Omnitrophota bacterium]MBU2221326.1 ribonuclease HII [Candidatus Omnitrophota bacterium]MBU2257769.1 ribonuclease HII [Candidatus Omnitrophota bacterium]